MADTAVPTIGERAYLTETGAQVGYSVDEDGDLSIAIT